MVEARGSKSPQSGIPRASQLNRILRQREFWLLAVLICFLGGCSLTADGAALFCLAGANETQRFTVPIFFSFVLTVPLIVLAAFFKSLRVPAIAVGLFAVLSMPIQHHLLDRHILWCDAP